MRTGMCYMKNMHIFEREVTGRTYSVASESIWDPVRKRCVSRQVVLGPVEPACITDLCETEKVGTMRVGDVGALLWVAEQLDVVGRINRVCADVHAAGEVTLGEMVLAVAVQRACDAGPKCELAEFLAGSLPIVSCLKREYFTGQAFHRLASRASTAMLDSVQIELARACVERFDLKTNVLAFDTTNFDTHIATTTGGELARRGHAKSKRRDLRVVGLGVMASEKGHVPLLHRAYPGNQADQQLLGDCLDQLGRLHDALDEGQARRRPADRTLVRDGGFWSEQLELELEFVGYYSIISLPMGHSAAEDALQAASKRGAMKKLAGKLKNVRAARIRTNVASLDRTLIVVESDELLKGQKRGIAAALVKARQKLHTLCRQVESGKLTRAQVEYRVHQILQKEHLASFVVTEIGGTTKKPTLSWRVDGAKRRQLEKTRLGKRVLCTDRHSWSTERIVAGFRGQWNVEELFRRSKGGGVVPWSPSHQWADGSLRLHTFATVLGLMLVSLARLTLQLEMGTKAMMQMLAGIDATLVRPRTGRKGRPPTIYMKPKLNAEQRRAVEVFELDRWMPSLSSCMSRRSSTRQK